MASRWLRWQPGKRLAQPSQTPVSSLIVVPSVFGDGTPSSPHPSIRYADNRSAASGLSAHEYPSRRTVTAKQNERLTVLVGVGLPGGRPRGTNRLQEPPSVWRPHQQVANPSAANRELGRSHCRGLDLAVAGSPTRRPALAAPR